MMNSLNGGAHATNNVEIQEFMIMPVSAPSFREALRRCAEVFHALTAVLMENGTPAAGGGDEGGYAPNLKKDEDALKVIVQAIEAAGYKPGEDFKIAIAAASSEWWDEEQKCYVQPKSGKKLTQQQLVNMWKKFADNYPIISLEDGMAETDWEGWAMLTKDIGELKRIFLSPGPIFDPEDRMDDYWGYTEAFYSVGFRPGDVVQVTYNSPLSPAGLMFEEPLRNLGCASIPAGPTDPGTQLDIMQKLRVSGYVGTASYLMHLAQKAEEKGINLRKDLFQEVAFVTGERHSEKKRNQLEKKIDINLRQGYGTADVGCIGYECFHKTGLHISNRCYVEICHPDTGIPLKDGEVGEIVVTSFNKTYPLIRLATGDLSYIDRAPCACGRTSPRLGSIVGRVDTTARIKGMFVYPHQVEQVMARFEDIKRWQIEVINPGGIDEMILYVEASNFHQEDELLHLFRERIKLRPELKVLAPGTLPPQIKPIEDKREWD